MAAYQKVDPKIVDFLIDMSKSEQRHRHDIDKSKVSIIRKNENRTTTINVVGMLFAFLSIVVLVGLTGYALYLDRTWFAGIMGAGTIISVASIFVSRKSK